MSFLSKIDIFKQTVCFNLRNETHTSSLTGKIITFLMIFYTLNTFFRSDLFFKTNPRVTIETYRPLLKPNIFLNNSNFQGGVFYFGKNEKYIEFFLQMETTIFIKNDAGADGAGIYFSTELTYILANITKCYFTNGIAWGKQLIYKF